MPERCLDLPGIGSAREPGGLKTGLGRVRRGERRCGRNTWKENNLRGRVSDHRTNRFREKSDV